MCSTSQTLQNRVIFTLKKNSAAVLLLQRAIVCSLGFLSHATALGGG